MASAAADPNASGPDPFATLRLRRATVGAWSAATARFREDAAAEDELVRGGYRSRAAYELAQNAADAARRAGVAGIVEFVVTAEPGGDVLYVANTGAPLDAAGLAALAALRASDKRDHTTVGRFGLGFTAVLELTSSPEVHTRDGGVRFSPEETLALIGDDPDLAGVREELGHAEAPEARIPILRLPFECVTGAMAEELLDRGYDTVVRLPLNRAGAGDDARAQLAGLGDPTLLALGALGELRITDGDRSRQVHDVAARWRIRATSGQFTADDRESLPSESAAEWWLQWALPTDEPLEPLEPLESRGVEPVIHAPTPSLERIGLPALLLGSFPVEPDRRRLAETAATATLFRAAGDLYADLVADVVADEGLVRAGALLPVGMPASAADSQIRDAARDALGNKRWLPGAGSRRAAPGEMRLLEGPGESLAADFAEQLPALLDCPPATALRSALRDLGVESIGLDEVIESYPATMPAETARLLTILSREITDGRVAEAAALVAVPMASGTDDAIDTRRGPRGLLLPGGRIAADDLAALGLPVIHPDACAGAAGDVLQRLGAVPPDPDRVLELLDDSFGPAILAGEECDPAATAAVVNVVAAATESGERTAPYIDHPWLAELPLPDADGVDTPAADLFLPGSPAETLNNVDDAYPLGAAPARHGARTLAAIGVQTGPVVVRGSDLTSDGEPATGPDAVDEPAADWLAGLGERFGEPVYIADVATLLGLDLIADWPAALRLIDGDDELRSAVVRKVPAVAGAERHDVRGPAAAWIARHAEIDGLPLGQYPRSGPGPTAPEWVGELSSDLQSAVLAADAADLDAGGWRSVLESLDGAPVTDCTLTWTALARSGVELDRPEKLAAIAPGFARAAEVDARNVYVAEAPYWLARHDLGSAVHVSWDASGAADLARALDLPVGSELADQTLSAGTPGDYPAAVTDLCGHLEIADRPDYVEHDDLHVDGRPVDWWATSDAIHASTLFGFARALAWAADRWDLRDAFLAVATGEQSVDDVLTELA